MKQTYFEKRLEKAVTDFELAQVVWDYMRFEQPLEKADVIIGLGSLDARTADWCAKLYHNGYAPLVVFTGATGRNTDKMFSETEAEIFAKRAIELGVPESAILKETRSTNTGENILYTYELLKTKNIEPKSIILVTKPYMLRRAYATFMKQWPSEPKPDIVCSALNVSFKDYCNDKTCLFELTANIMVSDLERIIKYPKLGYQIEQKVPDEVMTAYYELIKRGYAKELIK